MILKVIGRLFLVCFGFVMALLVGFLTLAYLGGQLMASSLAQDYGSDVPGGALDVIGYVGFLMELFPAMTLLPALLVVAIGEVGRLRSWMYYVLAGGGASLMVPLLYVISYAQERDLPSSSFLLIFATAGFFGGAVYWLIAGHRA